MTIGGGLIERLGSGSFLPTQNGQKPLPFQNIQVILRLGFLYRVPRRDNAFHRRAGPRL